MWHIKGVIKKNSYVVVHASNLSNKMWRVSTSIVSFEKTSVFRWVVNKLRATHCHGRFHTAKKYSLPCEKATRSTSNLIGFFNLDEIKWTEFVFRNTIMRSNVHLKHGKTVSSIIITSLMSHIFTGFWKSNFCQIKAGIYCSKFVWCTSQANG